MGVRSFFPGEGKIFQGGGAKTYYLPKKCPKHTIFFQKRLKHTILAGQGGQETSLALPADAHVLR